MATQSQLLNLAKQGNPQAIAALMNLVLEPKGVTTNAQLTNDCLEIIVQSEKPLNQGAIVSFIRSGVKTLGADSIRTVKVTAHSASDQAGEPVPLWTEDFQLGNPTPHTPIPALDLAPSQDLKSTPDRTTMTAKSWMQRTIQQASSSAGVTKLIPQSGLALPPLLQQFLAKINPSNQWMVLGGMAAIAFVSGGVVAAVTNAAVSPRATKPQPTPKQSFPVAMVPGSQKQHTTESLTDLTIAVQQNQVKEYLTKMSQAQQEFYQTNGRLASSLETLERSQSIPKSAYYTYKLTVTDQTQAKLTAVPKTEKLKSYISAVMINSNSNADTATAICESAQPSTFAPATPEMVGTAIACKAGFKNISQ
jgi:Tfp pilus assembly protein PilE